MNYYSIKNPKIAILVDKAVKGQWSSLTDIDWSQKVDSNQISDGQTFSSLVAELPQFARLSTQDQKDLHLKESIYHICNLLVGEYKGIQLCSHMISHSDNMDWSIFLSTILSDERNHYLALYQYLHDKLGIVYDPHPALTKVMDSLCSEGHLEIQLFIGQVILEWTATSLLASMALRNREPLLASIIRRIISDEGRHLAFNGFVLSKLPQGKKDQIKGRLEDLVYEAILACLASLIATPVWSEYGFSKEDASAVAIKNIEEKGVIRFYSHIVPKQLAAYGLLTDKLLDRLNNDLLASLIESQIHKHTQQPIVLIGA